MTYHDNLRGQYFSQLRKFFEVLQNINSCLPKHFHENAIIGLIQANIWRHRRTEAIVRHIQHLAPGPRTFNNRAVSSGSLERQGKYAAFSSYSFTRLWEGRQKRGPHQLRPGSLSDSLYLHIRINGIESRQTYYQVRWSLVCFLRHLLYFSVNWIVVFRLCDASCFPLQIAFRLKKIGHLQVIQFPWLPGQLGVLPKHELPWVHWLPPR